MARSKGEPREIAELRKRAEARLPHEAVDIQNLSAEEAHRLVQELRTHQIELEMQNEELRRAQEELAESRDRYSDLYDFAPVGYATVSHKGLILEANLKLADLLRIGRGQLLRQPLSSFISPDDQDVFYGHRKELLESKQHATCEVRMIREEAEPLWVELDSILIQSDERNEYCLRSAVLDITKRKQGEEERQALEAQLRQAQKMEAVGRLAGGIAHDFNNQLFVIQGFASMLARAVAGNEEHLARAQEIERAAKRSAELTHKLLAFSRKQILAPKTLNLNKEIFDLQSMLERLIGEDIRLAILPGPGLGFVKVDPSQLQQVIFNLAVNARDAMPDGGTLTIETGNTDIEKAQERDKLELSPGAYVTLSIGDSGSGMEEDTLSHLFEPFFTTKEFGKGTGLGLATVHGIVRQSGGDIAVESELGRGTTFKLYFPREEEVAEKIIGGAPQEMPRGSETVLVVEDENVVRGLVEQVLQECGYRVLVAKNGPEAFELVKGFAGSIDLLITDVVMPEMSGRELADRLAQTHPATRVIFMSGYTDDEVVQRGVASGDVPFLQKPYSLEVLLRKVREVLDEKPPTPPSGNRQSG